MILSLPRRFAFIHLPKTAGESVERAYDQVATWQDVILGGPPHAEAIQRPYGQRFGLHKHSTALEVRSVIGADTWNQLYSFAFVRDPEARVCSLYGYTARLVARHTLKRRILQGIGWRTPPRFETWGVVRAYRDTSSFADWLRHPTLEGDIAMRPQVDYLTDADGSMLVTEVLRFEDLRSGWRRVCERLELGDLELPHHNASGPRGTVTVTPADRAFIRERMAKDYERFGYR
jgi:hypothetical protein